MEKINVMKQAHAIARETVAEVGNYRIALSLALKELQAKKEAPEAKAAPEAETAQQTETQTVEGFCAKYPSIAKMIAFIYNAINKGGLMANLAVKKLKALKLKNELKTLHDFLVNVSEKRGI